MKPAEARKALFKRVPAAVQALSAQAHKERRMTAREEFKRTQDEAGQWNQQKPRL